ncbi:MAG: hypothetical protein QX197_09095 [Methylococcaceae bacterium]
MYKPFVMLACMTALCSCSIYQAAHAPRPVEYQQVKVGTPRTQAHELLGMPKMTEQKAQQTVDSFAFSDGYHTASKARIILYLAGDIFTAGLSEIIFWPIEENVFDGSQCKATLTYDNNEQVLSYMFKNNADEQIWPLPAADLKNTVE